MGTGIKDVGGTAQIHTTLFQTELASASAPTSINGTTRTGLNDNFAQSGGGVWATDAVGNGYVVPAGSINNDELSIVRNTQISRDHGNNGDTQSDYATAYINHGTAPNGRTFRYGIAVNAGATATQEFATNFANYFEVLQQTDQAHVVKYVGDNIYNYVIFDASSTFTQDLLKNADKPCVVMSQALNNGNNLKISLTNPNLGILAPGATTTYSGINNNVAVLNKIPQSDVVKVMLIGKWAVSGGNGNVIANIVGNDTEVAFTTINGLVVQAELVKADVLAFGFADEKAKNNANCQTILSWNFDAEGKDIASFGVERSLDGNGWESIASWQGNKNTYSSAEIGNYYYRLYAITANGEKTYSKVVTGDKTSCGLEKNITVYPNPTTAKITLNLQGVTAGNIKVYDLTGKDLTNHVKINPSNAFVDIDLTRLNPGVYLIRAGKLTKKVIKQ